MRWILDVSGALFAAGVTLIVYALFRRRAERRRARREVEPDRTPVSRQFQVPQFMKTGSASRVAIPRASISVLRTDALMQEQDAAANIAILNAYLADVADSLGADEAVYWRQSKERESLGPVGWSTPSAPRPMFFEMSQWSPLVKWAAEGRVLHFDSDARVSVSRLAAAPVVHDGELLGVVSVTRAEGLERGREYVKEWLPRHAEHIAQLFQLFELRTEYGKRLRQNDALLSAAKRVQGHKSQDALCAAIVEISKQVSSATDVGVIRWKSEDKRGWVQFVTPGLGGATHLDVDAESLAARACSESVTLTIQDAGVSGQRALFTVGDDAFGKPSAAVIPLTLEERVIGALVAAADQRDAISRGEVANIALLGALSAASFEMVWEMEEVNRRARIDALTGLANRRTFDEKLADMLAHSDRFGHQLSLIMVDVDHFKKVNDTYGHDAGDEVLRSLARTLAERVRTVDVCARFGGEEIAILLPQTSLIGATLLAEKLRHAVSSKPVPTATNEVSVTVSCGVASYPEVALTKEGLFAAADRALYDAKHAGRNQVVAAQPKPVGMA